jgi:hypothetical protein
MVKVTLELSEYEIQMMINCLDSVIDVEHSGNTERIEEIRKEFEKYLYKKVENF